MLVLSRRAGEQVVIPQLGVVVTVVEVQGGRVRLGVAAPPEVSIHRHEVWQRGRQPQELVDGGGVSATPRTRL